MSLGENNGLMGRQHTRTVNSLPRKRARPPHGASRVAHAMSVWSAKNPTFSVPASCKDARVYDSTSGAMHERSTPHPPPLPRFRPQPTNVLGLQHHEQRYSNPEDTNVEPLKPLHNILTWLVEVVESARVLSACTEANSGEEQNKCASVGSWSRSCRPTT